MKTFIFALLAIGLFAAPITITLPGCSTSAVYPDQRGM